jgi:hypothetical protein
LGMHSRPRPLSFLKFSGFAASCTPNTEWSGCVAEMPVDAGSSCRSTKTN